MAKIKRGGITYGRSHKNGGIPVKNQSTGEMLEVEGGEGIVNKRSMASDKMVTVNGKQMSICEAVSALNQMEGGVEFSCDDVEHKQFIEEMALGGELERGKRTEREHIETLRKLYEKRITPAKATEEVAKEHLKEDPKYYSKLAKMEAKMAKGGTTPTKFKKGDKVVGQFRYEYGEGLQPVSVYDYADRVNGVIAQVKRISGTTFYVINFDNGEQLQYPDFAISNFVTKREMGDGGKMKKGGRASDNPFESFGLKKDFVGAWTDKIDYFLKKSDNFCDVEKKYCKSNIDIDRADMPQIYEEYIPQYMDFLEQQGIDSNYEHGVKVGSLHPTQKNISLPRMKRMLERLLNGYYTDTEGKLLNPLKRVVIATKDGYLLDGHHRWASSLFLSPNNTVDVLRVNANIKDLVPISKNFGMVEFQKFMFGGKVKADLTLPKVSSVNEPQQDPKAQTSLLVKRGGFPQKGVTVMPLYEGVVQTATSGYENIGYTNNGITFTIGNTNLVENRAYSVGNKFALSLAKLYPSYVFETAYEGYSGDTYQVVPLNMTDINQRIDRRVQNGQKEGIFVYTRKYGKTLEISVIPFPAVKSLLEDESFLENVMDALNSTTKFPNAQLPSKKQKDTTIVTAPAPSPRFYEPNRKYRFKTLKELEFEFGTDWRTRFEALYLKRGQTRSKLYIGTKKCDYLLGKSLATDKSKWKWEYFWSDNAIFQFDELGLPTEGKIREEDSLVFSPFAITYDGFIQDEQEFNSKTRYRFLTKQECEDAGLDPNAILSAFAIKNADNSPLNRNFLPEMLFGREIPAYIYEWFRYLASLGLQPTQNSSEGALGAREWNVAAVFDVAAQFANPKVEIAAKDIIDTDTKEYKPLVYQGQTIPIPQALKNLTDGIIQKLSYDSYNNTEDFLKGYASALTKLFQVRFHEGNNTLTVGELVGIKDGVNISYSADTKTILGGRLNAIFAYDAASPYIKQFTYEEESLKVQPKIFSKENIISTDESNLRYSGAVTYKPAEPIQNATARYFNSGSTMNLPLGDKDLDLFFGAEIPQPIFEFYRYMCMISNRDAGKTTLGKDIRDFNTTIEEIAFAPSMHNARVSVGGGVPLYPSLQLFDVIIGAGENGEDLYKWNLDSTIYKNDPLNKTYCAKEIYNLCAFLSNGNTQWTTNEPVDLELWNIGITKIVANFRLMSGFIYSSKRLSAVFYENQWIEKNAAPKPYSFKRSSNDLDMQIAAIQTLMDSFTEDEIQVKSYLISEIAKLRQERESQLLSRYYGSMKQLLLLYASKISLAQRTANPNNGCGLATPSGAPSELDLVEYKIVRSAEFKNWFGDWELAYATKNYNGVSKAINPRTGEPLVFFHGKGNMQVEATRFGFGVFPIKYFGANFSYAEWFARNYNDIRTIYEFFVQVKNPIDFSAVGIEDITGDMFKLLVEQLYGYKIKTPVLPQDTPVRVWQILRANPRVLAEIRDNTAYDGFIFYEDNPQDILPSGERNQTLAFGTFKNQQSKAADGRNTTFFASAEDFRFNRGGVTKKC